MRAVLQRSEYAKVEVDNQIVGSIKRGLVILLGIEGSDEQDDISWLIRKIINMRIFNDSFGVMNESIVAQQGSFLVISQFTLQASIKKGNRPSYIKAAPASIAVPLYEKFIECLKEESGLNVETGIFGADMQVTLTNDGPVTIIIDSKNKE